ncbi:MAG TPA: hypothetical protein VF288_10735 [Mycobacteriales bacterium]
MSAERVTFVRQPGGWVAHGPADQVRVGPLDVCKADGSVCPQVAVAVSEPHEEHGTMVRTAYLGRGRCKAQAPS